MGRGMSSIDGKLHGNVQTVEAYNKDKKGGTYPLDRSQRPKNKGGHSGGVHDEEGHDEIKHVVGEHGAAHTHTITRAEDGDGYQSESHHEDGHVHHAHHPTMEHAHTHGAHAFDDADHVPADEDSEGRMTRRHNTESTHGTSAEFMPSEE